MKEVYSSLSHNIKMHKSMFNAFFLLSGNFKGLLRGLARYHMTMSCNDYGELLEFEKIVMDYKIKTFKSDLKSDIKLPSKIEDILIFWLESEEKLKKDIIKCLDSEFGVVYDFLNKKLKDVEIEINLIDRLLAIFSISNYEIDDLILRVDGNLHDYMEFVFPETKELDINLLGGSIVK